MTYFGGKPGLGAIFEVSETHLCVLVNKTPSRELDKLSVDGGSNQEGETIDVSNIKVSELNESYRHLG